MLASFRDEGLERADPEARAAFDEVIERNGENTEIAAVFSRIHNDLMEGFSSLVSMNLNVLVRTPDRDHDRAWHSRPSWWGCGA